MPQVTTGQRLGTRRDPRGSAHTSAASPSGGFISRTLSAFLGTAESLRVRGARGPQNGGDFKRLEVAAPPSQLLGAGSPVSRTWRRAPSPPRNAVRCAACKHVTVLHRPGSRDPCPRRRRPPAPGPRPVRNRAALRGRAELIVSAAAPQRRHRRPGSALVCQGPDSHGSPGPW